MVHNIIFIMHNALMNMNECWFLTKNKELKNIINMVAIF